MSDEKYQGPAAMEQRAKPAHAAMKAADGARKEAFADMLNPQAHQRAINALTAAHKKVEEHREHFPVSGEDGTPASAHMAGIKAELVQHGMYLTAAQLHEKADKSGDPSLHQGAAAVLDAARDNSPAGPHHQVIKEAADKHKSEARKAYPLQAKWFCIEPGEV